jgi:hypothetical protein
MSSPTTSSRRSTPSFRCADLRRSEFDRAVRDEFGPQSGTLTVDLVLSKVGDRTAVEALDAGVPPRDVWLALCVETDVPLERRYGVGRVQPKSR